MEQSHVTPAGHSLDEVNLGKEDVSKEQITVSSFLIIERAARYVATENVWRLE